MILPAAARYLADLLSAADRAKDLGIKAEGVLGTARELNELVDDLADKLKVLVAENAKPGGDGVYEKARHMYDAIIPAMRGVREVVDRLEKVVPDDFWPIPKYREMLFVK
jgi:glutamine synthetase